MQNYVALNRRLSSTGGDPSKLLQVLSESEKTGLNAVNCCTALQGLARNVQLGRNEPAGQVVRALTPFAARVLADSKAQIEGRQVSGLLWAAAKLQGNGVDGVQEIVQMTIKRGASFHGSAFKPQEASMVIWALGKMGLGTADVQRWVFDLVRGLGRSKMTVGPQAVANTLHGLGGTSQAKQVPEDVIKVLLKCLQRESGSMKPQEVANSWAGLAKVSAVLDPDDCAVLTANLAKQLRAFRSTLLPQHIANIGWAIARLQEVSSVTLPETLIFALVEQLENCVGRFKAQELSMLIWAMGVLEQPQALEKLSPRIDTLAREGGLDAQQVATIALALAKGLPSHQDAALVARAEDIVFEFKMQDIDNFASALARTKTSPSRLLKALARHMSNLLSNKTTQWEERNVANFVLALAKLSLRRPLHQDFHTCLVHCAEKADERLHSFNARDLSNFAWGMTMLGHEAHDLMYRIGEISSSKIEMFNAQECSKLLFAFSKANVKCTALEEATTKVALVPFDFKGCPTLEVEHIPGGGRNLQTSREATGTTGATGGALWQDSALLADWLARTKRKGISRALEAFLGEKRAKRFVHPGSRVVELGSGLGLPSLVAASLGMATVASDGDEYVLELLQSNIVRNEAKLEGSIRSCKLRWGEDNPMSILELEHKPRLILAAGVVYGKDKKVWESLAATITSLSNSKTVIVMAHGNGAAPGVHQLEGDFYAALGPKFSIYRVPIKEIDTQYKGCQIHVICLKSSEDNQGQSAEASRSGTCDMSTMSEGKSKKSKKNKESKKSRKSSKEKKQETKRERKQSDALCEEANKVARTSKRKKTE
mmetsp:Transcript_17127/g.31478  ORF Transcript_17127/g.31478 Transcript_17127/m.31478 type:complete len:827 (-) Transcript_17127:86-2566(-)